MEPVLLDLARTSYIIAEERVTGERTEQESGLNMRADRTGERTEQESGQNRRVDRTAPVI